MGPSIFMIIFLYLLYVYIIRVGIRKPALVCTFNMA